MPAAEHDAMPRAGPVQPPAAQAWAELPAPPGWRSIDFISDLHLQAGEPQTYAAWQHYMAHTAAQAVFILGDLFEVWVGDDVVDRRAADAPREPGFEARCAQVLRNAAGQRDVFFMCGNRDFLVGERFLHACGVQLLHDPGILRFAGQRWLLSHGDALCIADTDYMRFRALVRSQAWQQDFLAQPLEQRLGAARALRSRSEDHKRAHPAMIDLDTPATVAWLRTADASCLIHGHTHRPADHDLGGGLRRIVLSDWDLHATPARAQVLRLEGGGDAEPAHPRRLTMAAACEARGG